MWEDYIREQLEGFDWSLVYINIDRCDGSCSFDEEWIIKDLAKYLGDRLSGKIEGYEY